MLRSFLGFGWFWGNVWRMTKKGLPAWSLTLYKGRIVQSKTQSVAQSGNSGNAMHPNCHNNENRFDLGFDTGVNMTNIHTCTVSLLLFLLFCWLFCLSSNQVKYMTTCWHWLIYFDVKGSWLEPWSDSVMSFGSFFEPILSWRYVGSLLGPFGAYRTIGPTFGQCWGICWTYVWPIFGSLAVF